MTLNLLSRALPLVATAFFMRFRYKRCPHRQPIPKYQPLTSRVCLIRQGSSATSAVC